MEMLDDDLKDIKRDMWADIEFDDIQNSTRPSSRRMGINGEEYPYDISPKDLI